MKHILFLFIVLFFGGSITKAQPYEIRAVNKGFGVIGVEMRKVTNPALTVQNYITDIVFGLKWRNSTNVDLTSSILTPYNIKKSGTRTIKGIYYFQAFYADQTPFLVPVIWPLNGWVEIMNIPNNQNGSGTTTFAICERNFDIMTNPNLGIDLVDFEPVIRDSATNVSLPVTLLSFDVSSQKSSLIANWKTSHEINSKGFFLQSSPNTANNFKDVSWIDSKNGSATNEYRYEDRSVVPNTDYYYRLRQIDKDNKETLSQIRQGRVSTSNLYSLAPNPVKEQLVFTLPPDDLNKKYLIRITDSKGAVVYQSNEPVRQTVIRIPVTGFAAGNYFFACENDGKQIFTQSFVKL